jgi:hypothetical protein
MQKMAAPKLRIVYHEESGKAVSYFHLERGEALRAVAILKMLANVKDWVPVSKVARRVKANAISTQSTILKMSGAEYIDILNNGERQLIAERPVLLVRKEKYNTRNNLKRYKYLRPTTYVKRQS